MHRAIALLVSCWLVVAGCESGDETSLPIPTSGSQRTGDTAATAPPRAEAVQRDGVTVAADAFGFLPDGSGSYEAILVTGEVEARPVVQALLAAAGRFMLVTEDGREHPSDESVVASGLYSPNYVADPVVRPDGIRLYVDCKGVIAPPMAATFRQILADELAAAGVNDVVVQPDLE